MAWEEFPHSLGHKQTFAGDNIMSRRELEIGRPEWPWRAKDRKRTSIKMMVSYHIKRDRRLS
jgi:hypothetical protein